MEEKTAKKPIKIKKPSKKDEGSIKIPKEKMAKKWLILLIIGIVSLIGGIACLLVALFLPKAEISELNFPNIPSKTASETEKTYSPITGEVLSSADLKSAPVFCVQIPNGTDGARPQAGLPQAGVIFEAIAEAGITRFDAVFQNPTTAVIGPIRSLRIYYLDFAAPFDCTVTHAGGPGDAISALRNGGYRELDESYQYMFRSNVASRRWNNLFTTSALLKKYNSDRGYNSSNPKGFTRMTPEESLKSRVDDLAVEKLSITKPSKENTSKLNAKVNNINMSFASSANYNLAYQYDPESNTYKRRYQSGAEHQVYKCPDEDLGNKSPEAVCELTTLSPSVVIAMIVKEKRAAYDNYHEDVTMIGVGDAYIFQNGAAIKASWSKSSRNDQIKFIGEDGNEVKLAPGQTIISAIPTYGGVEY